MKKIIYVTLALGILIWLTGHSFAQEHGGSEHGGSIWGSKEHAGIKLQEPNSEDIRNQMNTYIKEKSKKIDTFNIYDPEIKKTRKLSLIKIHERVGKTGNYYYSCTDFKDVDTGQILDLDLDVEDKNGKLSVVDVRIHKVGGIERYTYDENDNRILIRR